MAEVNLQELMRKPVYLADSGYILDFVPIMIDGAYRVVLGVRIADGALDFKPSLTVAQRIVDKLLDSSGLPRLPFAPVIADAAGRIILSVRESDGALDFKVSTGLADRIVQAASFGPEGVTGAFDDLQIIYPALQVSDRTRLFHALDQAGLEHRYIVRSDIPQLLALEVTAGPIEMIVATGESTAAGGGDSSTMNLTTAPETHRCIMFSGETNGGTMGIQSSPFSPGGVKGFVPALETNAFGKGETQLTALGAWRDAQIVANGRQRRTMLLRTHAQRGATLAQISLGSVPYTNGLAEIARAVELAGQLYRRQVIVRQVFLTTGVNDRGDGTTRSALRDAIIALCDDYNSEIPPITGQDDSVAIPLIVDQVRAPASGSFTNDMALAQLDAIEADSRILLVAPEYFLQGDYGLSDPVHDLGPGYDVRGEYKAKLLYDLHDAPAPIAYTAWKGLRPASITVTGGGTQIDITFFVPVPPLVLDTTSLPDFGDAGFTYSDTEGGITISSVAILDADTVRLTMSGDITSRSNRTVGYADADSASDQTDRAKVWGNLRDSETRESRVIPGLKLYNWSAIFRKVF